MTDEPRRRTLGRGLSALIADDGPEAEAQSARGGRTVPIEHLQPGRFQPRRRFDEAELEELAQSIRENGVLQPILVRPVAGAPSSFEIVAGERRWRAAQRARLHEVPVLVREVDDRQALELALVENVQREDLNAIEEAGGYARLIGEFGRTAEVLAKEIGRSRAHVANTLRLLKLPPAVQEMVEQGELTAGHARALIDAENAEALARRVVAHGLSVRETERLASAAKEPKGRAKRRAQIKSADTAALERNLAARLGLKVEIREQGEGGTLVLHYRKLDQLDDLIEKLMG